MVEEVDVAGFAIVLFEPTDPEFVPSFKSDS